MTSCNFSLLAILLKRFYEQMLYRYHSKVLQLNEHREKTALTGRIQVRLGFNPWIIQYSLVSQQYF